MRITIQQRHIDHAKRMSTTKCAIAMAISESVECDRVSVDACRIMIDNLSIPTPPEAKAFLSRYDFGIDVEPFMLDLELRGKNGTLQNVQCGTVASF